MNGRASWTPIDVTPFRICLHRPSRNWSIFDAGSHGCALGRKNWLFAGSDAGGNRAAAIYTVLEFAKLNGIDPEVCLRHVFARITDHPIPRVDERRPWNGVPPDLAERLAA